MCETLACRRPRGAHPHAARRGLRLVRPVEGPIMDSPVHLDAWLESQRARLLDEPPDRSDLTVAAWLKRDIPPRDYLLEGVLSTTSRWIINGETGVGKTLLGLDLALAVAAGAN